jgi:transcriptional antiterminator NusG
MMLKWYAVHTRSNFEKRLATEFTQSGIESYCPTIEQLSRRRDRKKIVAAPLFPGYLFVQLSEDPQLRRKVSYANGVVSILGTGGEIEPVLDGELHAVRCLLSARIHCTVHPLIREGVAIRVVRGPFKGLEGTLIKVRERAHLAVSVQLIARSVTFEVDAWDVESAVGGSARTVSL